MYGNVPNRFVPDNLPLLAFGNRRIDYAHNTPILNAAYEILGRGIDERGWQGRPAILLAGETEPPEPVTYGELLTRVNRFAAALVELGVEPSDRVFWRLDNVVAAPVVQLATWQIGAVSVPSAPIERAHEIEYFLNDTEATVVVTTDTDFQEVEKSLENNETAEAVVVVGEETFGHRSYGSILDEHEPLTTYHENAPLDVASIYYTSGTTGRPKGCIHSHASEVASAEIHGNDMLGMEAGDVMFSSYPIGHAAGNVFAIGSPLRCGAQSIFVTRPPHELSLDLIEEHCVKYFYYPGTTINQMMDEFDVADRDFSTIEVMRIASRGNERVEEWIEKTGVEPLNSFGASPMRGIFLSNYFDGEKVAPRASVGRPADGYEAKLVDPTDDYREVGRNERGQLAIRGPTGIAYWQNIHPAMPDNQERDVVDGWSVIDDMFEIDDDGNIWWIDRVDNMISSSGRQIAPSEVIDVVSNHEAVADIAVLGVPDDLRGEITKAFVVVAEGFEMSDELIEDIQAFAKAEMAPYKYPREIEAIDEIPRGKTGKIQYLELREDG